MKQLPDNIDELTIQERMQHIEESMSKEDIEAIRQEIATALPNRPMTQELLYLCCRFTPYHRRVLLESVKGT